MKLDVNGAEHFVPHGEGLRKWIKADGSEGDRYEGAFRDGQAFGAGKFTYANGGVYEGEFENDRANGTGTYTQAQEGIVKTGMWKDNQQHGEGTEMLKDGSKYEGHYQYGAKAG